MISNYDFLERMTLSSLQGSNAIIIFHIENHEGKFEGGYSIRVMDFNGVEGKFTRGMNTKYLEISKDMIVPGKSKIP